MIPTNLASYFLGQIREAEERNERIYEAVIGIVTDNKDPDKLARVKVRFPTLPGTDTSWWAPLAALGAGKERGWFFLPEIDDEVLVMFAHGDVRRPIVLGAIWNGKDNPPDKNDGKNERRTIVSRAGSKIIFDDDKDEITLTDGNGTGKIVITKDKITLEAASGDVCLQAPKGELNVVAKVLDSKGSGNFHIDAASGGLQLGGKKVTFDGGQMLQLNGSAVKVQSSGASAPEAGEAEPKEVPDPVGK
ncbi:MAG TPA: phage baseplate assembly protein V [Kofleriaceae bacterium]|nr:phage baseplate assembly protein V [Kofleriaceae bacterium]